MAQHGTRLRIDAWLPMEGTGIEDLLAIRQTINFIRSKIEEAGGEIIKCEDRVTSRREKP